MRELKSSYMRDSLNSVRTIPVTGSYESIVNYHLKDKSILTSRTIHTMKDGVEIETTRSLEALKDGKTLMRSQFTLDKDTNIWKPNALTEPDALQAKSMLQPRVLQTSQQRKTQEPEMGGPGM